MSLSISSHLLHFFLVQTAGRSNCNLLFFARAFVLRPDFQDAISTNVKGDLNLGYTPRRRQNAIKYKTAQSSIIRSHGTFPLQHMDFHTGLIFSRRAENLALSGGYCGVPRYELCGHTTQRFYA